MILYVGKAAGIFLTLIILPELLGRLVMPAQERDGRITKAAAGYVYGMVFAGALFELVCVPLILLHRTLTETVVCWAVLMAVCMVPLYLSRRKNRPEKDRMVPARETGWSLPDCALLILILLLLGVQCGFYAFGAHYDEDDSRYVVNAVEAYETDTLLRYHPATGEKMEYFEGEIGKEVTSPATMLYAAVSRAIRVHPTFMMHSVWPVAWLLLSYAVYACMACVFYPSDRRKRLLFLLICMIIVIMGYHNVYGNTAFILSRLWQGKSLVPAVIAPLFLLFYLRGYTGGLRYYLELTAICLFSCLTSGMGVYMGAFLLGITVSLHALRCRSVKLWLKGLLCAWPCAACTGIYYLVSSVILR